MEFGIFTVGDVTTDPTTGTTVTEHERIKNTVAIAMKAEEVGLDVVAVGQHHNPPFVASAPTTTMAYIGAQTERIKLSTSTTLITTTDPVRIAEDYATLQHLLDGRMDLMLGRGNTGPVYPWFGKDIRDGHPARHRELRAAAPALARGERRLGGQVPHAAPGLHLDAPPARRRAAVRLARLDPQPRDRRAGGVLRRRVLLQPHLLAGLAHRADGRLLPPALRALRPRQGRGRDRRARRPGLHGEDPRAGGPRVPPLLRQRAGLRPRPVAGGVHPRDAADRRARPRRSSSAPSPSGSTPATTSASCSSSTTPACR